MQVALKERCTPYPELLEAANFAKLRSEGDYKLLLLLWRNTFPHTSIRDVQISHLAQVRSKYGQSEQDPGTFHFHFLHSVQLCRPRTL
jgi:hypothetical protein